MTSRVYIDPRRLDKRVRVEVSTVTKGASGGFVTSWNLVTTRWAGITGKAGMTQALTDVGGGEVAQATHVITMYFMAGLTPTTHRIVHAGTVYEILHANDIMQQGKRLDLLCRTGLVNA